jgi:predicted small lipoprotein YifL
MQRAVLLVFVAFFLAAVLGACGSRGPLDDDLVTVVDSGVIEASVVDANVPDVVAVVDAGKPVVDAGTGLIQCGTCVAQTCGTDVTTCLTDPSCQTILTCVATTCFGLGGGGGEGGGGGGGGLNPSCLLTCTGSGGSGVGEALGIFQCITGSCGNACGGLLGGLGGGGGIPDPAPPSVGFAQKSVSERQAIFEEAFSAWPEVSSHADPTSIRK